MTEVETKRFDAGFVAGWRCAAALLRAWFDHGGDPTKARTILADVSDETLQRHAEAARGDG